MRAQSTAGKKRYCPGNNSQRTEAREKALELHAERWFIGLIIGDTTCPLSTVDSLQYWLPEQKHPAAGATSHAFWNCSVMLVVGQVPLTWEQILFWLLIYTYFQNGIVYLWLLILWEHTKETRLWPIKYNLMAYSHLAVTSPRNFNAEFSTIE